MRRLLLAVVCSAALALTTVGAAGDAVAAQGVLSGTWTSTDHDGSHQTLRVAGSGKGAYAMFIFDDSATGACDGRPAHVVGKGVADQGSVLMQATLTCLPGGNVLRHRISVEFFYSAGSDTLTDQFGVVWHRA